uniref:STI1 domain-containing protein n=1 Tax=Hanusia phi TaxID=3032 RepID=A0A7S0DZ72_9CRYP
MRTVKKLLCSIALAQLANGFSLLAPGASPSLLSSRVGSFSSPARQTTRTCDVKMMAKKGKKSASSGAKKGFAKNEKGNEDASGGEAAPSMQQEAKTPTPQSSKSVAAKPSTPAAPSPAAIVRRDENLDEAVLREAQAILEANKKDLCGGMGNMPPKTFKAPDGSYRSLPENYLYGITGDAEIVFASSKHLIVRLKGKFWGTRRQALESIEDLFKEKMGDKQVLVEEESQLLDLYLRDVFYDEEAFRVTSQGPQFFDERGIQVAQPFNADGTLREMTEKDEKDLKAGIEEMMIQSMQQSGGTFLESQSFDEINESFAKSVLEGNQVVEVNVDDVVQKREDKLADISKESINPVQSNPMFEKIADALQEDSAAVEELVSLLDKSNGNIFSIMMNPKFQSVAKKMMSNPELLAMLQDPQLVQDAMKSAQTMGLTDSLGIKVDPESLSKQATSFAEKTVEAVKSSQAAAPNELSSEFDALAAVEERVRMESLRMKESDTSIFERIKSKPRDEKEMQQRIAAIRNEAHFNMSESLTVDLDLKDGSDESNFLENLIEESKTSTLPSSSSSSFRDSMTPTAVTENALYFAGFIVGISSLYFFFATQLGVIDIPFMRDLGAISTPASRRIVSKAPEQVKEQAGKPVVEEDF